MKKKGKNDPQLVIDFDSSETSSPCLSCSARLESCFIDCHRIGCWVAREFNRKVVDNYLRLKYDEK